MIRVQLNDAIHVDVDTDDPQRAAEGARIYFARQHPTEFAAWQEARPLPGFGSSFVQGARSQFGAIPSALGVGADAVGLPGGATLRAVGDAIEGAPDEGVRDVGLRDFGSQPLRALGALGGGALGSIAGLLATGLGVGASIRGALALGGRTVGMATPTAITVGAGSAASSTTSLDDMLRAEGVEAGRAAALSATLGPLIGVAEAGPLLGALRRALGRDVSAATAAEIARRSLAGGTLRAAGQEAAFEAGGEAARQGLVAAETGNLDLGRRGEQVALGAIGGALGGAAFGAPTTYMERSAARAQLPPPAAPPPAPAPPAPWLPPEPSPFTERAEAEEFIQQNRAARPGVSLPSDEALLAHVNTLRRNAWEQEVGDLRVDAIRRALGGPPTSELEVNLSPNASVGQQIEARIAQGKPIEGGEASGARVLRPAAQSVEEQAEIVLPTLLELGQTGTINLQAIEPTQVAEHILGTIDASTPTDAEVALVNQTLRSLKRAKYLMAGSEPGTYTLAQRSTGRPSQQFQPLEQPGTADQQAARAFLDLLQGYVEVEQTDPQRKGTPGTRALSVDEIKDRTRLLDRASPTLQDYVALYLSTPDPNVRANLINRFEGFSQPAAIASPSALEEGGSNLEATTSPKMSTSNRGTIGNWEQTADPDVVASIKAAAFEKQEAARQGTPEQRKAFFDGLLTPDGQQLLQQMVQNEKGAVSSARFQQLFAGQGQPISQEMAVAAYQAARQGGVLNRLGAVNPNFKVTPKVDEPPPAKKPLVVPPQTSDEKLPNAKIKKSKLKVPPQQTDLAEVPTIAGGQRTQEEVNEAVADFYKMVGTSGRLELAERLLVEDLDSEVQGAAAAAGISWPISGYAQGDLAVLSLGNSAMPLNQVAVHEGWHVAENVGLITGQDVDLLNANLERIRETLRPIAAKWGLDVDSLPPQEVRAYGLNARLLEKADFGFLNQVFDKVKTFIGRIRNFMKGRGFTDWRDAYDSFAGGERASFENAQHVGFPVNFSALMQEAMKRAKVTDTPEFKNWFGASQVVDAKGQPKIVYHGTKVPLDKGIQIFRTKSHGNLGAHFGSLKAAHVFVQTDPVEFNDPDEVVMEQLQIYPVYLKIENPLRLEDMSGHWAHWEVTPQLELMVANGLLNDPDGLIAKARAEMDKIPNHLTNKSEPILQKLIQDLGYDGVVYSNDVEDNGRDSYIVFRPEQIKSAVGNSTFNPADQRIQFAAPYLPSNTAAAHKVVKDHLHGSIGKGVLRYFASPVLTMGKVAPSLMPASDVQKTLHTRTNEFNSDTEELLASAAHINDTERAEVTRLLDKASRTGKQSDISSLSAAAQQAYKDTQASFQRAFDFAIEALTIEHYRQDGKSAADVAKLDKLWAKHAGKHLWEIPKNELRVASNAGWKAIEELEKLRDPYFLPQVADGTHFIAAYKKDATGKKVGAPLRMYAYTPNSLLQRMRGQANPVEALKAELAKEFDPARHYIMQDGAEFTRDKEANDIRGSADFISQYLNELKEAKGVISNKAAQEIIGRMGRQLDKLSVSRVFKPNQDILRAVNEKNASRYLLEQGPQYLLGLSKVQARWFTESTWTKALEGVGPNDKNFLNDLRDYSTTPTEAFGGLRTMMFFTYLGLAPDTAAMNALQMLQTTAPMMTRDGANPTMLVKVGAELARTDIMGSAFSQQAGKFGHKVSAAGKTPDEKEALERASKLGIFSPVFTNESRGQFVGAHFQKLGVADPGKWADGANKIARYAGTLMQGVEQMNRAVTFLAAYREAKAKPEIILRNNRLSNRALGADDAFGYATNMVNDTQFITSKEDRAYIQRFTPAAEVATQFLSFPLKMFELWLKNGYDMLKGIAKLDPHLAKAGAIGFIGMATPIVALAGVWALPGADFLKELFERLTELWSGDGTQNFDADMRRLLGGGQVADAVLRGIPHATGGMSLSKRLAIDPLPFNDLMSMSIMMLAGPAGSYAESVLRNMPQYYANQDYFNMAAALLPRALGNVVRGAGVAANEEVYSLRGNRVISPQMVAEADSHTMIPAWFRVGIGLQPPEFVNARELLVRSEEIDRQMRAPTERFNKDAARHMLRMIEAGQTGDVERSSREARQLQELIQKTVERNARELDQSRWININMDAVRRRALNDLMGRGSPEGVLREAGPRNRQALREEINLR